MTKTRSTKSALISSVLALVLCFTMLLGTTFAWFTDSVTSANNIIKSGTLVVEMYYADGTKAVPADDSADWKNADGVAIYTADQLWEPGYTDAKHIKVSNEGSLALKYQLAIVPTGEVSKLAEVIDVYLYEIADTDENATQVENRDDLNEAMWVGTLADVISKGIVQGNLEANTDYTTTIVLKMQETADNNYQGLSIGGDFTIQLLATQYNSESDSFDTDYDKDAWMPGMQVYTAEDLQAAINAGESVKLMDDIEVTEPIVIPASAATTMSLRSAPVATVIDLNGKTLSNATGTVIRNEGNLVITGAGTVESTASSYAIRVQQGSMVIDSADIAVKGAFGAVSIFNGADVTINGGNYYAEGINGMTSHCVYVSNSTLNIYGGTFDIGYSNEGMGCITGAGTSTVNIYDAIVMGCSLGAGFYMTNVTVYGGVYEYDPATLPANKNNKLADGYKTKQNADGLYVVYFPQESFDSLIENAGENATIEIPAGNYTFPVSKLDAGQTLNCAPGTVFEGTSSLNVNGATIVGATFSNESGQAVSGTINGTFKDCVFEGNETLRWCYTSEGETVVFENCVFKTDYRGVHFDGMNGNVIFKNCEINGFNAYSGTGTMTFENCKFGCDESNYNGLNIYSNTKLINCEFTFISGKTNFIDMEGTGKKLELIDCSATLDGKECSVIDFVGGSKLAQNIVIVADDAVVKSADALVYALASGYDVLLYDDVQMESATTAPYGNKYAVKLDGGVLDGNGNELYMECYGDDYGVMTSGGTVKNITIQEGCRAIMIMYPTEDVILDNVNIGGDGVLYPINTGEKAENADNLKLIVSNSTIAGWTSYEIFESASFTNVKFEQGTYYNNIYGRVLKPYVTTVLTDCSFVKAMNLDLSALIEGHKITITNCTVNGQELTADVITVSPTDEQYDTELFTVDLPSWATSINDCIVFN